MAALKDYTTICNSAPSEFLAELALRHRKTLAERNLGIIADNLKVLDQLFERHAAQFSWRRPQAGSIGFPRLLGKNVEAFCEALVNSAGVLLLPGTLYGDDGNHFRIGFGRRNLPEAVGRLEQFLEQF
jgi:aspartate/methionine/tyrosine aminotransferase